MRVPVPIGRMLESLVIGRISGDKIWLHVDHLEAARPRLGDDLVAHQHEIAPLYLRQRGSLVETGARRIDNQNDVARRQARRLWKSVQEPVDDLVALFDAPWVGVG